MHILSARLLSSTALTAVSRLSEEGRGAPGGLGSRGRARGRGRPLDTGFSCLGFWGLWLQGSSMPTHPLFLSSREVECPSWGCPSVVGVSHSLMPPEHYKASCTWLDPSLVLTSA